MKSVCSIVYRSQPRAGVFVDWGLLLTAAGLVGVPYGIGASVVMGSPSKSEACFAKACFWTSALLAIFTTVGETEDWPMNIGKLTLLATAGAVVAIALSLSLDWARFKVKTNDSQSQKVTASGVEKKASANQNSANMEIRNTENLKASKNITLGPGKLAVVEGGKDIVIEGNFVDMSNRESASLDDYRDADLSKLGDAQLRATIIDFAGSMRDFERKSKEERCCLIIAASWHNRGTAKR